MNKVILSGFLGQDPELKQINANTTVVNFSMAYNEKYGQEEVTHWFNFKAFNKTAEFIDKYFSKGKPIEVEGRLLTQTWEKDGHRNTSTYILVDNVSFVPGKKE